MPYLTGDDLPVDTICRSIRIPNTLWCVLAVNGALYDLAENFNWQQDGLITAQEAADRFWDIWLEYQSSMCIPIGTITPYAGLTPPAHTLFCDGSNLLVADFEALFAVIGYSYGGSGDNFNLPDLRARVPVGAGAGVGLSTYALGELVGEEAHTLIPLEMPSHSHFAEPHSHGYDSAQNVEPVVAPGEAPTAIGIPNFTVASGVTIDPTGGDGAHENRQPSIALNYIIFVS